MAPKTLAVLALLGVGCATPPWRQRPTAELNAHVRHLAAQDLQCPERDLHVQEEGAYAYGSEGCSLDIDGVTAHGCGREAHYDFDERGAPRLRLILPDEPELRQWVQEALQAQPPDTAFALGQFLPQYNGRELEVLFFPTQDSARWKLYVRLMQGWCDEDIDRRTQDVTPRPAPSAPDEPIHLWASTCGKVFRVIVTYNGPPALMPAPRGLHLQQLADALATRLSARSRPNPTAPSAAAQP